MCVVLWRAREGGANLGAREADVEHAGDEHVEVAAGHLAGEPDEGEDGEESEDEVTRNSEVQVNNSITLKLSKFKQKYFNSMCFRLEPNFTEIKEII